MNNPESVIPLLETGLKRINSLKADDINEANTRLQIVDEILLLLGWLKKEFSPEHHTGIGNYTDYLIKVNGIPHLVVEAKRIGKSFHLPKTINKREYTAKYLINHCGAELKEAMLQASQYCNETGAPYAVVTNGEQWIIFRGLASSQKGWIDYKAIVFYSPEILRQCFTDFWNLLAKNRVNNGSLSQILSYDTSKLPSFAHSPNFETENIIITGRTSQKDIDTLFDYYFDDIVNRDNGKMMSECYVEENEVKEYRRELQSLLKDRMLSLGDDVETEELTEIDLISAIETPLPDERAKVVLLVGHVGAGKSTFLRRFFGRLEQNKGYAKFIFDILSEANPSGKVRENETELISKFILNNVSDYYYKKKDFGVEYDPYNHDTLYTIFYGMIRKIRDGAKKNLYIKDAELLERDIAEQLTEESKNSEQLLPKYLKYIYKRKKPYRPFCLVFDNVDRASDEYQEFIYYFAHSLAKFVPGVIIISMRETTFHRAKQKGFLDTRASDKVFQLNAPNIKRVIAKRLKYLSYQIEDPKRATHAIRSALPRLEPIAEHLKTLLLLEDNSARELVTSIANRSVRRAFKLLRQYASSPFAWENFNNENAGQHLLRGLMLSKQIKYVSNESPIVNVFAVPSYNRVSHFTVLKILAFLFWKYQKNASFKESPKVADILSVFESLRASRQYVKEALSTLINAELVECDSWYFSEQIEPNLFESGGVELLDDYHVRITAAGYYYLNTLASNKLYAALCSQDTIWYSQNEYNEYIEEYKTYIELAKQSPEYDFLSGTKCLDIWLRYLGIERFYEEKLLSDSVDMNWWNLAFRSVETVTPNPKEASARESDYQNKPRKKARENKPTLWDE